LSSVILFCRVSNNYRNLALCRVFFVGYSTKKSLSSAALGKVLLSVTTTFTESKTPGTEKHSAKTPLSSAQHSANDNSRQRVVNHCLKLTAVIFVESRVLALGKPVRHSAEQALPSVPVGHSAKYIFIFFILPTKLFVVCSYTM
jgi:hypothetical protein